MQAYPVYTGVVLDPGYKRGERNVIEKQNWAYVMRKSKEWIRFHSFFSEKISKT